MNEIYFPPRSNWNDFRQSIPMLTNVVVRAGNIPFASIQRGFTPLAGTSEQEAMNAEIINHIKTQTLRRLFQQST